MGADQIAAIRPAIVELEEAARADEGAFVARFAIPGRSAWVEVVLGTINLAYPYQDDPDERLKWHEVEPLPGLALTEWQPGLFATFRYEQYATAREVARFVDRLLGEVLDGGDYAVDVELARLAE